MKEKSSRGRGRPPKHPKTEDAERSTTRIQLSLDPVVFAALEEYRAAQKDKTERSDFVERLVKEFLIFEGYVENAVVNDVRGTWLRLLAEFNSSFWATNYIKRDDIFTRDYAIMGRTEQKRRTALGRKVRKIFIADDLEELKGYEQEMNIQAGTDPVLPVKYILYDEIFADEDRKELWKACQFESIDFQIFDGEKVLIWLLDRTTRAVKGYGRLMCGKDECRAAVKFYDALWEAARSYNPKKGTSQFEATR